MSKSDIHIERKRHHEAFEVYRDLGFGRTFREVGRRVNASADSVSHWAQWFKWDERVAEHEASLAVKEEAGAIVKVDTPIARKLLRVMGQMESLIDSSFQEKAGGKFVPLVAVEDLGDLTKFVAEYRKFLETYSQFIAQHMPDASRKDRGTTIKEFNMFMGSMSQEERIAMMKEVKGGNEPRGDRSAKRGSEDADYQEIPRRGDED